MSREPQEKTAEGEGVRVAPPLRELHSAATQNPRGEALHTPWGAFVARILRPANTDHVETERQG